MEASFARALGALGLELQHTVGPTSIHTVPGREGPAAVSCSQSTLTAAQEGYTLQEEQLVGYQEEDGELTADPLKKSPLWKETKPVSLFLPPAPPTPCPQRKLDYIPPTSSPHPHKALSAFTEGGSGVGRGDTGVVAG